MKKRPLTLMEVMLSLGIVTLLLAVMFPYLRDTIHLKKDLEQAQAFVFSKAHVQARLGTLFSQLTSPTTFQTNKNETQLQFTFKNERDLEQAFKPCAIGHLSYNQGKLILKIEGKEKKIREEVLLKELKNTTFKFVFPTPDGLLEEKDTWKEKTLPLFFIIKTEFIDGKEESFCFRLPTSNRLEYP